MGLNMAVPTEALPLPSVVIVTRNEAARLPRCLAALAAFPHIVVVDSESNDDTASLARAHGAELVSFHWNGQYPKKRQWCLEQLALPGNWVLFIDADEIMTPALSREIRALFSAATGPRCEGYFIAGRYVHGGRALRFGLRNHKLALLDRRCWRFPEVDDLDLPGMGEIEGHYQPVAVRPNKARIGRLGAALLHEAGSDGPDWLARHQGYASWEAGMNARKAWPRDPVWWRQALKTLCRAMPGRATASFLHCYVLKAGFLDGKAGWQFARCRAGYYRMIGKASAAD